MVEQLGHRHADMHRQRSQPSRSSPLPHFVSATPNYGSRTISLNGPALAAACASASFAPVSGNAVTFQWPSGGLQEVVVTAQRREESAQRAAVAVTAVSSEQLENAGVCNPTDLTYQLVPGLFFGSATHDNLLLGVLGSAPTASYRPPRTYGMRLAVKF